MRHTYILKCGWLLAAILLATVAASAMPPVSKERNAQQARHLFNEVYNKVFGPEGCSLSYSINIIGIYKTAGTVVMRQKKLHYTEKRYHAWSDGKTLYRVDTKKKVVDIFDPNKANKDNMASKYTYDLNKFKYSWSSAKEGIVLNIDAPSGQSGVRHAKAIIDRKTHYPLALKVKVAFFWTTVKLSNFREGGIDDKVFIFPHDRFKSYKFNDKRNE